MNLSCFSKISVSSCFFVQKSPSKYKKRTKKNKKKLFWNLEKASCRPALNPLNDLGLILPTTLPWETNARQALGQLLEHFEVPELFYAWAEQRNHVFGVQMSAH